MKRLTSIVLSLALLVACDEEKKPETAPATTAAAKAQGEEEPAKKDEKAKADAKKDAGTAVAHLASDCEVVAQIDVGALMDQEQIKAQVVPALGKLSKGEVTDAEAKRLAGFLKEAGIEPEKDLKQIAICVLSLAGDSPTFFAALSGDIEPGKVVPAIMKNKKEGEKLEQKKLGGVDALVRDGGEMVIGQAEDGVIIAATSEQAFEKGLSTSDGADKSELPLDKAASVVIPAAVVKKLAAESGGNNPFKSIIDKTGRTVWTFDVGSMTFLTRAEMADDKSATEAVAKIEAFKKEALGAPPRPGDPMAMLAPIIEGAQVKADGKTLVIETKVPKDVVESGAKELAKSIESGLD